MTLTLLGFIDFIGTIAFAISGAIVGIHRKMDLFGVNVLAIVTSTGGGVIRDLLIGTIPPTMFRNPFYVAVAAVTANIVFALIYRHRHMPQRLAPIYDSMLFWFDSLGLGAFAVDGVMIGVRAGYGDNLFLIVFLGFLAGVGGGVLRDVLADRTPDILVKHVYALAAIAGALVTGVLLRFTGGTRIPMLSGFTIVIVIRVLAAHYLWNLPRIEEEWKDGDNRWDSMNKPV